MKMNKAYFDNSFHNITKQYDERKKVRKRVEKLWNFVCKKFSLQIEQISSAKWVCEAGKKRERESLF